MSIDIYQIHYANDALDLVNRDSPLYDCRDNPEQDRREMAHMYRFYREHWDGKADYLGLMSTRFTNKTGITHRSLISWIETNPGYDVYFINPWPQLAYFYHNQWTNGVFNHPLLIDIADQLFEAIGLSYRARNAPRATHSTLLYCNYWVGNHAFWTGFMDLVGRVFACLEQPAGRPIRERLLRPAPYQTEAVYYPFLLERLFTTFLTLNPDVRALPYPAPRNRLLASCNDVWEGELLLRWADRIDAWDAAGRDGDDYRQFFAGLGDELQMNRDGIDATSLLGKYRRKIRKSRAKHAVRKANLAGWTIP